MNELPYVFLVYPLWGLFDNQLIFLLMFVLHTIPSYLRWPCQQYCPSVMAHPMQVSQGDLRVAPRLLATCLAHCRTFTHWGRDKMATIFQTISYNAFSWMKIYQFRLWFHWNLFPRVQLTIFNHWFGRWLGASQETSHYLNQSWLFYWRIYVSLGLSELTRAVCYFRTCFATYNYFSLQYCTNNVNRKANWQLISFSCSKNAKI